MNGQLFGEIRPIHEARLVPSRASSSWEVLGEVLAGSATAAIVSRFARTPIPRDLVVIPVPDAAPLPTWVAAAEPASSEATRFIELARTLAAELHQLVPDSLSPDSAC